MKTYQIKRPHGFALFEAMIALLLIAGGLLAVTKLQGVSLASSGESKARSEATNYSRQMIESLRNRVIESQLTNGSATVSQAGTYATYTMTSTISTPNTGLKQTLIQLHTTWNDHRSNAATASTQLDMNSLVAWDDPGTQARLAATNTTTSVISPTGAAQAGTGSMSPTLGRSNGDGSRTYTDSTKTTYLLSSSGAVLLTLAPKNNSAQAFTTISGRVYFDQSASNSLPASQFVELRLSSQGSCVYDHNQLASVNAGLGGNSYKYFSYTCYVGPGWYGNLGVTVDGGVNGSSANPNVCVGDPGFNQGSSDGTLISPDPTTSTQRAYRGFKVWGDKYYSTGMVDGATLPDGTPNPAGGNAYGTTYNAAGTPLAGPHQGYPTPSRYPSSYPLVVAGSQGDYFNQDFLLTSLNKRTSCGTQMAGGLFSQNAGAYVCIKTDNDIAPDVCPSIWPGFEGRVGGGGGTSWSLTVAAAGNGTGTVTSNDGIINCGARCQASYVSGTSVTLTAAAAAGSTFAGWSGCTTVFGSTCTVLLTTGTRITPTFTATATTFPLTLTKSGTGSGSVTSTPAGLSCAAACTSSSASFPSGTLVTLNAAAAAGSTFAGWGGACSGTGTCAVTLSGATAVTVSYTANAATTAVLSVSTSGSGSVTSMPTGINCGSTCQTTFITGQTITLTAVPATGYAVASWSGCTSVSANTCTVKFQADTTVSVTFSATCSAQVTGTVNATTDVVTSSTGDQCTVQSSSLNFSCGSITAVNGSSIILTDTPLMGVAKSTSIPWTCNAIKNVSF